MATNLEFIKSASGTQVSTLDVTDCFSDKYDVYKIIFNGTNTDTAGIYSAFRVIVGGTAQASGYDNATLFLKSYATFTEERRINAGDFENVSYMSTGANGGTFDTSYNVHFLTVNNFKPAIDAANLMIRFFESGVLESASVYQFAYQYGSATGVFGESRTTTASYLRAVPAV